MKAVVIRAAIVWFSLLACTQAAVFPGNAHLQVADPTGGLSETNQNQFSISMWLKLSVPSGVTLNNDMIVMVNRTTGSTGDNHAYLVRYNYTNGKLEFSSKGTAGSFVGTLIDRPYFDRWYHVAVRRQNEVFDGYVDGAEVVSFANQGAVGNAANTNGVSIGGWNNAQFLYGEVQEVAIYQEAVGDSWFIDYMTQDQPTNWPTLRGYYKLGYSTNTSDQLRNFAVAAPSNTAAATTVGAGAIVFEEVNQLGEQSLYDSRRNNGRDAISPLSGAFMWSQTIFQRPTPGMSFLFEYAYNSANRFSGYKVGDSDALGSSTLGTGWRHTFDTQIVPSQLFQPSYSDRTIGIMTWDGGVEIWDKSNNVFRTRHNEYRGEVAEVDGGYIEWTTPNRLVYRFRPPYSGSPTAMRGRLEQIRDFNSNAVQLLWLENAGRVTQVVDTAGGRYTLDYAGQYLTNVSFGAWSVGFQYNASNQLISKIFSGPSTYSNVNTRWGFQYNPTNGLLNGIVDPRSNTVVQIEYDRYGRKVVERDALSRARTNEYAVPGRRDRRMTDPAGNQWIESLDRKGRMTSLRDPLGNISRYEYDDRGNTVAITQPLGWRTTYAYDDRANKIAETNELGQVTTWTYHPFFNKALSETNPVGWGTRWTYDAGGNLLKQSDDLGTMVTYTYATNGLVLTATDANSNITTFSYDANGFLIASTDPLNNVTRLGVNEWNWKLAVTNALGQVTRMFYDLNGNVIRTEDPISRIFYATYDPSGNLTAQSDGKNQYTYHSYNAANERTQTVDRANNPTRIFYNQLGDVDRVVDALGNMVSNTYDAAARLIRVTDPLTNTVQREYDANNNVVAVTDQLGRRSVTTFDRLNRVVAQADPLGNTVQTTYDDVGRVKTVTSPNGFTTVHDYDGRGRLTRWLDAEGYEWLYAYDGVGNITNITDAMKGHYVMTYGKRNERLTELNQDTNFWQYAYDQLARLKTQTDPNGTVRTLNYDDAGRLESVNFNSGRVNSFVYDDNNNPELATRLGSGPTTTTRLQFDIMDRITECKDHFNKKLNFTYDALSRRTSLRYPDGKVVTNRFDALSRLTNQTDWAGRQMSFTYDKVNRLLTRTFPNGIVQSNAFDEAGRQTALRYGTASSGVLTDGLVAYYPFDGASTDASGSNNHAILSGGTYAAAKLNSGFLLNGTSEYALASFNLLNSIPLTLSVWVRPALRADGTTFPNNLISNDAGGTYGHGIGVNVTSGGSEITIEYQNGFRKLTAFPVSTATWQHVCAVYQSGNVKTYLNGVQVDDFSYSQGTLDGSSNVQIGKHNDDPGLGTTRYFAGQVDEVRIYNRALASNEVASLFLQTNALAAPSIGIALSYAYDRNGNKVSHSERGTLDWTRPAKIDETARYTAANKLIDRLDALSTNDWVYHYDPSGNMTNAVGNGQSFSLWYDEDNRTTQIKWDAGVTTKTISNRFDAVGRRIARWSSENGETRYVLDLTLGMEMILCDTDSGGAIQNWYVHGPGGLAYRVDATNGLRCYHPDAQGNVISLTDAATNTVAQYAYTPYGRVMPGSTSDDNPYRFVGSQGVMNEFPALSGLPGDPALLFMRARYYSADAGVFLSTDPAKNIGPGWFPVAFGYASGNPMSMVDPTGLWSIRSAISSARSAISSAARSVASSISSAARSVASSISSAARSAGNAVSTAARVVGSAASSAARSASSAVSSAASSVRSSISRGVSSVVSAGTSAYKNTGHSSQSSGVLDSVNKVCGTTLPSSSGATLNVGINGIGGKMPSECFDGTFDACLYNPSSGYLNDIAETAISDFVPSSTSRSMARVLNTASPDTKYNFIAHSQGAQVFNNALKMSNATFAEGSAVNYANGYINPIGGAITAYGHNLDIYVHNNPFDVVPALKTGNPLPFYGPVLASYIVSGAAPHQIDWQRYMAR